MGALDEEEERNRLVEVRRFRDPVEAQMAKGMLESVGIECFLEGANANALYPLALRVGLQVRGTDEAEAVQLLMEAELGVGDE